jgi:hypothetical protein
MGQSYLCRTIEVLIRLNVRIRKGGTGLAKRMRTEQFWGCKVLGTLSLGHKIYVILPFVRAPLSHALPPLHVISKDRGQGRTQSAKLPSPTLRESMGGP